MDAGKKIRLLVIDDSATVRAILCRELARDERFEVIGYARDGQDGVEKVAALRPDVITLDVEMPRLNGLEALERIMRDTPTRVVMVSSLTSAGAAATMKALDLGAVDFIAKPVNGGVGTVHGVIDELREKIAHAATARLHRPHLRTASSLPIAPLGTQWADRVVVIGSSTGGPQALRAVLTALPADLNVPVLIVQHMPPGFTRALADRLNELGPLAVKEARPGSHVERGTVLIAPGGFHMAVRTGGLIELTQTPSECGVRPAANVLMESAAAVYGAATVGVVLTGMGKDGTRGAGLIKEAGGEVIAEDESTCVVYGMPRSVAEAGYVDHVAPLDKVAGAIVHACRARAGRLERAV